MSIDIPIGAHTAECLTHLIQILWTKEELINKAVGAPRGFEISHRFIEMLYEELPASVSEFLFLWEKAGGEDATKGIRFDERKIHFEGSELLRVKKKLLMTAAEKWKIKELDADLVIMVLDHIKVYESGRLTIRFFDGTEFECETE